MKIRIVYRMTVVLVAVITVFLVVNGCDKGAGVSNSTESGRMFSSGSTHTQYEFPFEQEDPNTGVVYTGTLYMWGSALCMEKVNECVSDVHVVLTVRGLLREGFTRVNARSKYISTWTTVDDSLCELFGSLYGWQLGDSISIEITTVVYQKPTEEWDSLPAPADLYAVIQYTEFDGARWGFQKEKILYSNHPYSYFDSDEGPVEYIGLEIVDEGSNPREVWVQTFMPHSWDYAADRPDFSPAGPPNPRGPDIDWDWGSWFQCTTVGTSAGCATAAVGCTISNVAWGVCTGVGCGASAVASAVGCSVKQILEWSMDDEPPDSMYTSKGERVLK
jgi:hypothetical protein